MAVTKMRCERLCSDLTLVSYTCTLRIKNVLLLLLLLLLLFTLTAMPL
jgi:hypothetical protein